MTNDSHTAATLRAEAYAINAIRTTRGHRLVMSIEGRPSCLSPAKPGETVLGEYIVGTGDARAFYSRKTWQDWQVMMEVVDAVKDIKNGKHHPEFPEDAFVCDLEMVEASEAVYVASEERRKKVQLITYTGPGGQTCVSGYKSGRANKKIDDAANNASENFLNSL